MFDILTIGDIKLDTFVLLPEAHVSCQLQITPAAKNRSGEPTCRLCLAYGTKIPVRHISSQIAGTAPNVAVGIARLGKRATVASVMGDDGIHDMALRFLKSERVTTDLIQVKKHQESSFAAVIEYEGESTQLVAHGNFTYHLPTRCQTEWLHLAELGEGYKQLYKEAIRLHKKHTSISMNPGSIQIKERDPLLFELLHHTAVLFLNTSEARTLLKEKEETSIHQLISQLYELGSKYVVVTDGKNGAYAFDGETIAFAPAFPGTYVEGTGAGDAFSSGFLGALMYGHDHKTALAWGSVNAASVIGSVGPTKGLLSQTEIKKRLHERPSYRTKTF